MWAQKKEIQNCLKEYGKINKRIISMMDWLEECDWWLKIYKTACKSQDSKKRRYNKGSFKRVIKTGDQNQLTNKNFGLIKKR